MNWIHGTESPEQGTESSDTITPVSTKQYLLDVLKRIPVCSAARNWLDSTTFSSPHEAWSRCPRGEWLAYIVRIIMGSGRVDGTPSDLATTALRDITMKVYSADKKGDTKTSSWYIESMRESITKNDTNERNVQLMMSCLMGIDITYHLSRQVASTIRQYVEPYVEENTYGIRLCIRWRQNVGARYCKICGTRLRAKLRLSEYCRLCHPNPRSRNPCTECGKITDSTIKVCRACQMQRRERGSKLHHTPVPRT